MFYEYWGFDEWSTIATIGLSVVAIIIAIWSSRSTSKAADKQIGEMQKQICEIKKLSALQIETTIKLVEVELYKVMPMIEKNAKECKLQEDINNSERAFYGEWEKIAMRNFQNTQSQRDFDMYKNIYHNLNGILKGLKEMRIKQTGV